MSSTNKTTHYELSQFLGTDKPAWLGDYNSDMQKIDTGINGAQTTATGADGKADSNAASIGTLTNLTTDDKTSLVAAVNEVDGHADTAQGTATSAANTANAAATAITNLGNYLTMSNFTSPEATGVNVTISQNEVSCAANNTGTLGKIYGRLTFSSAVNGVATLTFATPIRPTSTITVNGGTLLFWSPNSPESWTPTLIQSLTIAADGTCTITVNVNANQKYRLFLFNSLIFATDFGDVPTPE